MIAAVAATSSPSRHRSANASRCLAGNAAMVSEGDFLMGTASGQGAAHEEPEHTVTLGGAAITLPNLVEAVLSPEEAHDPGPDGVAAVEVPAAVDEDAEEQRSPLIDRPASVSPDESEHGVLHDVHRFLRVAGHGPGHDECLSLHAAEEIVQIWDPVQWLLLDAAGPLLFRRPTTTSPGIPSWPESGLTRRSSAAPLKPDAAQSTTRE